MDNIILENERDKRALLYLKQIKGEASIKWAIENLAGSRKAYVSNIAKLLRVELPAKTESLPLLPENVLQGAELEAKIDALFLAIGKPRKKPDNR